MKDVSTGQNKEIDDSMIAPKQQLLGVILCFFMVFSIASLFVNASD